MMTTKVQRIVTESSKIIEGWGLKDYLREAKLVTEESQALAIGVQPFRAPSTTICRALQGSWIYLTDGLCPWFSSGKHGSGTVLFLNFESSPISDSSSLTSGQGLCRIYTPNSE